jgi:hypothetical protein
MPHLSLPMRGRPLVAPRASAGGGASSHRAKAPISSGISFSPENPAVKELCLNNPQYQLVLGLRQAVTSLIADRLGLVRAAEPSISVLSPSGTAGAEVFGLHGGVVRWISVSAVADGESGFGGMRLMGFVDISIDVPHLSLEAYVLPEGRMLCLASLLPRADLVGRTARFRITLARASCSHVVNAAVSIC